MYVCICVLQDAPIVLNRKKKFGNRGAKDFDTNFEFGERDVLDHGDAWVMADVMKQIKNKVEPAAGLCFHHIVMFCHSVLEFQSVRVTVAEPE